MYFQLFFFLPRHNHSMGKLPYFSVFCMDKNRGREVTLFMARGKGLRLCLGELILLVYK